MRAYLTVKFSNYPLPQSQKPKRYAFDISTIIGCFFLSLRISHILANPLLV